MSMDDRLHRSREDRVIAGVAGGLAELWDADPSLVRVVWALLMIFTGGIALLVYVIMAIVVPEKEAGGTVPAAGPAGTSRREARLARRAARRAAGPRRDRRVGVMIGGILLILLGSWLLLREWLPDIDFDWIWPAVLIAIGVIVIVTALGRRPEDPGGAS